MSGAPFWWVATHTVSHELPAPQMALREPNGLLAAGGELTPTHLWQAYQQGIFPWYNDGQPILWWSPDPRAVIRVTDFHASRRLRRTLRQHPWRITLNCAFAEVVAQCAAPRARDQGTWLNPAMQAAYCAMHALGRAHSLEVWRESRLVGGVYGVAVGRVFSGESMFSRVSDTSKIALFALCRHLAANGYAVLDCQIDNPHLTTLGCETMPRDKFIQLLREPAPAAPYMWMSAPLDMTL